MKVAKDGRQERGEWPGQSACPPSKQSLRCLGMGQMTACVLPKGCIGQWVM